MDDSKKAKDKELETEVVTSMASFEDMTKKISEFLYYYTLKTAKYFDKGNPKILGNVAFWLEQKNAQTILMYNVHPKQWNINRITHDLDLSEKEYYEQIASNRGTRYM
jgi:hypothetical protein